MGSTGNSTGVHLHLEASTTEAWQCSSFVDPGAPLGIPNVRGTIVEYDGSTPPTPPIPPTDFSNSKKWLMTRAFKLRINLR